MQKEKQILLAFFDILGTSKMLNKGDYQNVYDYREIRTLFEDGNRFVVMDSFRDGKLPFIDYFLLFIFEFNYHIYASLLQFYLALL